MKFLPRPNLSIRVKLTLLVVMGMALAVTLSAGAFINQHIATGRQMTVRHASAVGDVLAGNVAAAISFVDADAARETLETLRRDPPIDAACVFDCEGHRLAEYRRATLGSFHFPRLPATVPVSNAVNAEELTVIAPVSEDAERVGSVFVRANLRAVRHDLTRFLRIVAVILLATVACSVPIAYLLQYRISRPIIQLADSLNRVSVHHDYAVRVPQRSADEIGMLYGAFNEMLTQIQSSEEELKAARDNLEMRVLQRTRELTVVNSDLQMEVARRSVAEQNLVRAQRDLVDSAHKAGMAEVATGVLHNVGNVLNSVNVSANIVVDRMKRSPVLGLSKVSELIRGHLDEIGTYLTIDERGKLVPPYLSKLAGQLAGERDAVIDELSILSTNVEHIKRIVSVQQGLSKVSGLREKFDPSSLFEEALKMVDESIGRHGITVNRDFAELPDVESDRNKVLQIIVNLVQNALDAVVSNTADPGCIDLVVRTIDPQMIVWRVTDNGIGIKPEDLTRIFQHGFTTKPDGHGYGLHASCLAAKELGGSLEAISLGPGQGATFQLQLPRRAGKEDKRAPGRVAAV